MVFPFICFLPLTLLLVDDIWYGTRENAVSGMTLTRVFDCRFSFLGE